ncbi:hypothetical protein AMATHDRAFT_159436 [Amanita thiersii Skay4041]|uniref:Macrofage activating glycoprotein n=1 Tax=Amanita thiersii Skay4041 TaxID=703135 RepID=A0A2A9NCQ5_9AGAR|nr:hypothetical protein AMATHDRAFT_159436 [Amanita thiersii Skay4041]
MSPVALSRILPFAALAISYASAQAITGTFPPVPLASKHFQYPNNIPYKVDTDTGLIRGTQKGYNQCNSTTENQNSLCQTFFFNAIDDFCLWAPPDAGSTVADEEGEMVAWCTKPGRGTRLIPEGALKGVQFMKTPDYIQVVGFIDQTKINLAPEDFGGEMDPHGADLRGNPMGGIVFSTNFSPDNKTWEQVIEWHNFMGGNAFCLKACDPKGPNAAHFCEHVFDRIGCAYNAPNNAQNGTFEACQGDNQDFPGVYTTNGAVVTYSQPPESLGPITSIPYTARVPASSNCVQYQSTSLYAALASVTASGATPTASGSGSVSSGITRSTSRSGTATGASATSTGSSNDATTIAISGMSLFGVIFSALFLS